MINFNNINIDFTLDNENRIIEWIEKVASGKNFILGDINYIFCDDIYLNEINKKYLNHEDFTDIISFDYTEGSKISGDIFISIDRVDENTKKFKVSFKEELYRVMIHGILHYIGYKDKTDKEKEIMRDKESEVIKYLKI